MGPTLLTTGSPDGPYRDGASISSRLVWKCSPWPSSARAVGFRKIRHLGRVLFDGVAFGGLVLVTALAARRGVAGERFDLLASGVRLNRPGAEARKLLDKADLQLADARWDDAIDTLLMVSQRYGRRVVARDGSCYVTLNEACHARIAGLPPAALTAYRRRVDTEARSWYDEGIAGHDAVPLRRVVDRFFCSSWGDDALLAIGEIALERSWYTAARAAWDRILPRSAGWGRTTAVDATVPDGAIMAGRPVYPDSTIDAADIDARLVLVSVREGDLVRARHELTLLSQQHGDAKGMLDGQLVNYVEALTRLLDEAANWPAIGNGTSWLTYAGSLTRNRSLPELPDTWRRAWSISFATPTTGKLAFRLARRSQRGRSRLQPAHYPVVVGELLLVTDTNRILAYDLVSGHPAWGLDSATIYEEGTRSAARPVRRVRHGSDIYSATVADRRLYARMGDPTTVHGRGREWPVPTGALVCIDLASHGRLVWRIEPDASAWSFEGSPVVRGDHVYIGMCRNDARPETHIACFDAATGQLRWRHFVCAAETAGRGQIDEVSHRLLALAEDTLYLSTGQGVVAAWSVPDGHPKWLHLYRRHLPATRGGATRGPETCVVDRGRVMVAPIDSQQIIGLDAATGRSLWMAEQPEASPLLLGTVDDYLLAHGNRLWWIDTVSGSVAAEWPGTAEEEMADGFGRGLVVGNRVYWPTKDAIFALPAQPAMPPDRRDAADRIGDPPVRGGNLLLAGVRLIVAENETLHCLIPEPHPPTDASTRPV
ncbi:MAG: PQQ-binding-like beta-propeller repeat protein, partial [Pirellulales bacterium]